MNQVTILEHINNNSHELFDCMNRSSLKASVFFCIFLQIVNFFLTLCDMIRVADDMGKIQFQLRVFGKPLLGWKGSFVVANVSPGASLDETATCSANGTRSLFVVCVCVCWLAGWSGEARELRPRAGRFGGRGHVLCSGRRRPRLLVRLRPRRHVGEESVHRLRLPAAAQALAPRPPPRRPFQTHSTQVRLLVFFFVCRLAAPPTLTIIFGMAQVSSSAGCQHLWVGLSTNDHSQRAAAAVLPCSEHQGGVDATRRPRNDVLNLLFFFVSAWAPCAGAGWVVLLRRRHVQLHDHLRSVPVVQHPQSGRPQVSGHPRHQHPGGSLPHRHRGHRRRLGPRFAQAQILRRPQVVVHCQRRLSATARSACGGANTPLV